MSPTDTLPLTCAVYWRRVRMIAELLHSDGCTHVLDIYKESCLEHDVHYRLGRTINGAVLTRGDADRRFRQVIQQLSPFKKASPFAWWRWMFVRLGGGSTWNRYREQEASQP